MGCRITSEGEAVLYDSTNGMAFGPVFKDMYEAEDFLAFCSHRAGEDGDGDPRELTPAELAAALDKFNAEYEAWGNDDDGPRDWAEWLEGRER